MNTIDVLKHGHLALLQAVENVPDAAWETPGVCGTWSVKEILAHLASYEQALVEVLNALLAEQTDPPPLVLALLADPQAFNDKQVAQRQSDTPTAVLAEYKAAQAQAISLAAQIPAELFQQNGVLPWYGESYDLDDFLAYTYYGHKREHSAEINVFNDRLAQKKRG
jgi:uncharacterized protein (TIGR03083 family)